MKTISKKRILLAQIKAKRNEMYEKAKRLGFTHPQVVACSQELDHLLNKYTKIEVPGQGYRLRSQAISNF